MAEQKKPILHGARVAPGAVIVGDVVLEEDCNVWYGAVLRGDSGAIRVGAGTNIQDGCVLHDKTTVGRGCTLGHGAIVHGCTLGDYCLIGMGAVVLSGARLGECCLVGGGAVVTGKTDAPAGSMLLGNPARIVRQLTPEQIRELHESAEHYIALAREAELPEMK